MREGVRARLRRTAGDRRTVALFVVIAVGPAAMMVNSFRPFVPVRGPLQTIFEVGFRYTVYYPIAAMRAVFFDPLGLEILFALPVLRHGVILALLLAFYYAVSVLCVAGARCVRERRDASRA
ncbi:hypothetical protein [Halovivax limisalsi]|uniref:hypothetical protein n=1 Tax=Halovivax limisalsi TaxID=1453760 RepID=UPI001FFDD8C9|nr:hypothetical protein [Halovivax limisalsi]